MVVEKQGNGNLKTIQKSLCVTEMLWKYGNESDSLSTFEITDIFF